MRLVTYNIQYSLGKDERYDLARSLATVAAADIICLQEVERNWKRSGMTDQPVLIEQMMADRYCVYAGQFDADASYRDESGRVVNRRRQLGQMTLSRWPIVATRMHVLPKLDTGERMSMMTGTLETVIDAPDGPLRLFNLHLSDTASSERLLQIQRLMDLLERTASEGSIWTGVDADSEHWETDQPPPPMPLDALLLGDFNAEPTSQEYSTLCNGAVLGNARAKGGSSMGEGGPSRFADAWAAVGNDPQQGVTFPANPAQGTRRDRRLDYCFLPETMLPRLKNAWIDGDAIASDHQPFWIELA